MTRYVPLILILIQFSGYVHVLQLYTKNVKDVLMLHIRLLVYIGE